MSESKQLVNVQKKPIHRFQPGVSGNPAGRPKGSRNAITLQKLALEGELRAQLKPQMGEILTKGIALAIEGDKDMIRYFLDKWITPAKATSDDEPTRERVQILIGRLEDPAQTVKGAIIEHE